MPPDKSDALPIGSIIDGKFRVTKEIGRGGMAAVFEAENVDIGKRVAVKVLAAELVQSRVVTERFIREARAAAAIRSPHICDVYDVGTFETRPFLVMELLEGESLYDRLSRVRRLDIPLTVRVASQTAKGLSKAHAAGIVHRDLKPENIFLTKNEEGEVVAKIVDFGLAKFYEPHNEGGAAARLTKEGALFGTPAYMSPEQAKAQGEVDHRSDLWALACIVYECLTGRTVWNVDQGVAMILAQIAGAPLPRPSRTRDDLPLAFDEWFKKALDRNPDRRFQTARELADTLYVALTTPGTPARPPISTDEEGDDASQPFAAPNPVMQPMLGVSNNSDNVAVPLPSTLPPSAKGKGPGFAIFVLATLSALVIGAYAVWFYVIHPSATGTTISLPRLGGGTEVVLAGEVPNTPAETEPYALQVSNAQERLARGDAPGAIKLFRDAFQTGRSNAARSLMNHAEVTQENGFDAKCRVTGLGRPRPFTGHDQASSQPTLAVTPVGVVVSWTETVAETKRRHAFSTLLDPALRRVLPALVATPEAQFVQIPELFPRDDGLILTFWDTGPDRPGVYLRQLDAAGRIVSAPVRASSGDGRQSYPAMARLPDGSILLVWSEKTSGNVIDLMARKLSANLNPIGDVARLTALRSSSAASRSAALVAHGFLAVTFAVERPNDFQVFLLRTRLDDPALASKGLDANTKGGDKDQSLGQLVPISIEPGKHNDPDIACIEEGCFIVWDDEMSGALAAFVNGESGEVIWRREIASKGLRPSIARSERGEVAVAWFEANRLRIARITRDGLEPASVLAKASGYQPAPGLVPGTQAGQWYVSWRDFEAARHEAFVLRAECK